MIKIYQSVFLKAALLLCCGLFYFGNATVAQGLPELMYFKFSSAGTSIPNSASSPVGNNPATISGSTLSVGGTGQFGTALSGSGGSVSSNYIDLGWNTNLASTPWTISFWVSGIPSGSTLYYLWGDAGNSMRCFVNGAPGQGNMRLVGTGLPNVDITDVTSGPTVVTYVREVSPNQITAYKNGVVAGVFAITGTPTTGTGFRLGAYSGGTTGLSGLMDEFRMYNRALSALEVSQTWNQELPLQACTAPPIAGTTIATADSICTGVSTNLSLSGSAIGSGLTYQWQSSNSETGTYTALGAVSSASSITVTPATTTWYRAAVNCSGQTSYSTPVRIYLRPAFAGGTYTINSSAPTGSGNFSTFTAAVNAISCGINGAVVFNVNAVSTPYNEQIIIPEIGGASATNTITFNGNNANLQFASTNTDARAVIKLDGADYVRIKNLNITSNTGTYGWGIHATNQSDNDSIVGCTITLDTTSTSSNFCGIVVSGSNSSAVSSGNNANNMIISGNNVIGGYYGIVVYGTTTTPFLSGNKVVNNTLNEFYYSGIYMYGNTGALVSGNTIQRLKRSGVSTTYALYLGTYNNSLLVEKNKIWKLFDGARTSSSTVYCIYISSDGESGKENKIVNNLVSDINHNGSIYGLYNTGAPYMQAYHNTISLDNTSATAGAAYGFYQITSSAGIEFKNNIISITRGGSGVKYCIYKSTAASPVVSNYNDLYINSAGSGAQSIGYQGGALAGLSNWQSTSGQDANSLSENPLFSNAGGGIYIPTAVAIDNKGTYVGVTTDLINTVRSATTPDLGAYEFTPALPVQLISFSAIGNRSDAVISWSTVSEIDLSRFVIQRSTDGNNFVSIGSVASIGNSNRLQNYNFTDADILARYSQVYYRLQSVNKDGSGEYSKVVLVKVNTQTSISLAVYPTPAIANAFARISTPIAGKISLQVLDQSGRIVGSLQTQVQAGTTVLNIPHAEQLSAGVYLVKVILNGTETVTRLVK